MAASSLSQLLTEATARHPGRVAVEEPVAAATPPATLTYAELDALSTRAADRLRGLGVRPRDRVGLYLRKSIDTVAAIFGVLKIGAAYVPVDPRAPAARNAYILDDCAVALVMIEERFRAAYQAESERLGGPRRLLVLDDVGGGQALARAVQPKADEVVAPGPATPGPDDLAYILYTSGSTGRPKGVMLSHRNALSFVHWCSEVFAPVPEDRFSSHAPFHFDLSILDIYVSIKHGAALVLVPDDVGKEPQRLAPLIAERRISVWYSAPSILSLLGQYGNLATHDYSALRLVLFAGEVFPVKHLRALKALIPEPRYFNLYGPTETNVCTFYEVPREVPVDRTQPYPIGRPCSHYQALVVDGSGQRVERGGEGELCISGPGVMGGYWNLPEPTANSFLDVGGRRWYRTGDVVVETEDGNYVYVGRRDRMVKRRGYRVELGEIEAALYGHPAVAEAAALALADADEGVRIKVFLGCRGGKRPSLIELKRFCSEHLPAYMIPDVFSFPESIPKTSTDKVDYQRLKELG